MFVIEDTDLIPELRSTSIRVIIYLMHVRQSLLNGNQGRVNKHLKADFDNDADDKDDERYRHRNNHENIPLILHYLQNNE